MNMDRLTIKAAEAVAAAAKTARTSGHPEIAGTHLLKALLEQEGGIVAPVLEKLEVTPKRIAAAVDSELARRATVSGGAIPGASRELRETFDLAENAARNLNDAYVSTEHLLIGLTAGKGDAARILRSRRAAWRITASPGTASTPPSKPSAVPTGSPTRTQRTNFRRSPATPTTSPSGPAVASSTPSSAATTRSAAS